MRTQCAVIKKKAEAAHAVRQASPARARSARAGSVWEVGASASVAETSIP